ncbi:adenosine deaminase 2-like [Amyelois transitella]|uniref:adenosine deaminase 2-like n=1 Tax=Amyelois transitella TaxID=680683 RepID=UPI0029903909|nr:adenosine deaminase 2-like [Amyelois transitella]
MQSVIASLLFLFIAKVSARSISNDHTLFDSNFKAKLIAEESRNYVGGNLVLNEDEQKVNDILMKYKLEEIDDSFHNPQYFNFSKHYFTYKNDIDKSSVYQIIKKMPKGAALHIHSSLMLHSDDMLLLTYEDHLYACYTGDKLDLQFSENTPARPCPIKWTLLSELRNASDNVQRFDDELRKFFTLYSKDENVYNADIDYSWQRFNTVYRVIKSVISYRPAREKFIYMTLKRFYDDNVMYVEIRSGLHNLYELDGTIHDKIYLAELYQQVTEKFIMEHPDFLGIKFILTNGRSVDIKKIQETLLFARKFKNDMPEIFAGFDLVGQEDKGKRLSEFMPALVEAKGNINYYFHAGETNWLGTTTDENLFDAIALGTKRIGHGYALIKHPSLLAHVLNNDIALEVNVISNVVLSLVHDVRNHPLATYLALGVPVVISSDDPGAWDSDPLSHDFYVTFVGVASRNADLRLLKQLALNSIKYSSLDTARKVRLYEIFEKRWKIFLSNVIEKCG